MHSFIEFFFKHIELFIMGLSILAISLAGFYLIYNVFFSGTEPSAQTQNLEGIEELLKRVLTQAESVGQKFSNETPLDLEKTSDKNFDISEKRGSLSHVDEEKINQLQSELKNKQKEIENLKNVLLTKESTSEPSVDLLSKISELEARLLEYEIIEDDIADLSKYKDENAKLKDQLAKLQSGESIVEDNELSDDGLENKEVSEFDTEETTFSSPTESENEINDEIENKGDPITDDLISEFEQAVNEQLGRSGGKETAGASLATEIGQEVEIIDPKSRRGQSKPESIPEIVDTQDEVDSLFEKAASEVVKSTETSSGDQEADDIFGEFVPNEEVLAKEVNTDKMLEEMSNLSGLESDGIMSLDEDFDVDKMAKEAQTLDEKGSS